MDDAQFDAVINQAIGLLIGRHGLDPQGALDLLRSTSSQLNSTMREVALQMVNEHDGKAEGRNALA